MKITKLRAYKLKVFVLFVFVLVTASSCTTEEDIRRQQMVDNLSIQMIQQQKQVANQTVKVQNIEERLGLLRGNVEDKAYKSQIHYKIKIQNLEEEITILKDGLEQQNKNRTLMEEQLTGKINSQKEYLEKLLATLSTIEKKVTPPPKSKKPKLSPFKKAMYNYRKGWYKTAKVQLLQLLNDKKIKGNNRARILHNLGMIAYINKKYEQSVIYFSKLFTGFPKAPYNPNGLLFLGRSFLKMKKIDEARQSFNQVIIKYPKHKRFKEAKKELDKLK